MNAVLLLLGLLALSYLGSALRGGRAIRGLGVVIASDEPSAVPVPAGTE